MTFLEFTPKNIFRVKYLHDNTLRFEQKNFRMGDISNSNMQM